MKKLKSQYIKMQMIFLVTSSLLLSGFSFLAVGDPSFSPLFNEEPFAEIVSITPNPAISGEQVSFVGKGRDPENETKYFSWDFNGDGTWEILNDPVDGTGWVYHYADYTYSSPGYYNVVLRVMDVEEDFDTDTDVVEILDRPPTVDITYPAGGQTVNGITTITGTASDPDSEVVSVEIKIDEGNWNAATGTDSWQYSWDTHIAGEGGHVIYARSLDDYSSYSEEDSVNVVVKFLSDLECAGSFVWTNVKPGATLSGSFTVDNVGEEDSSLDWEVVESPSWGTWTFEPSSGEDLKPDDEPITVSVTVVAPSESGTQFTGEIKIVNKDDANDFETIDVSLKTPKGRAINTPLLKFLQDHPHLFRLIQLLSYRLGLRWR